MKIRSASTGILVGALLAISGAAQASLILDFSTTSGASLTIADGGIGDTESAAGVVGYHGSLGNFDLTVTTGIYDNNPSGLHLNSVDISCLVPGDGTSNCADSLTIKLTGTDFTTAYSPAGSVTSVGGSLATGATASFQSYFNSSNAAFGMDTLLSDMNFAGPSGGFSGNHYANAAVAGPYSLTLVSTLTQGPGADGSIYTSSFDHEVSVPEPGAIALLGIGLLGIGLAGKGKRRENA